MAIILDLAPQGQINTYTALVEELRDLQDNADYSTDAIDRAVRKAETYFSRRLRIAEMEISDTLAVTDGVATLPTDCRELRSVVWLGGIERPLAQMSLSGLVGVYGGYSDAVPCAYAREAMTLRLAPLVTGVVRFVYYASLPPLSDATPSNWLLSAAPDLYVAGAQYYLCRRERDSAGAQLALGEMEAIIQALNEENARRSGGNMVPQGIAQVCGSRA